MQHVYGHTGNLGNECADHAAALGDIRPCVWSQPCYALGLLTTLDASAFCGDCNNIGEVLGKIA